MKSSKLKTEPLAENFDICPYCGASNPAGGRICMRCGEEIEEGDQELY
jgi:ribosomal protein L40E